MTELLAFAGEHWFLTWCALWLLGLGQFDAASLQAGQALHWWPAAGRAPLERTLYAGLIVRFQARASAADTVLIGAGADYWTSLTAPWIDHTTNPPVGMGRLRYCTTRWQWFCFGVFA